VQRRPTIANEMMVCLTPIGIGVAIDPDPDPDPQTDPDYEGA
jgi:hypothetical protein